MFRAIQGDLAVSTDVRGSPFLNYHWRMSPAKKKCNKIKSIIYFCCCDLLKVEDVTFWFYSVYQVTPFQHSPVSSEHTWVVTAWVEYLRRNDEETVCTWLILKNCSWKLWHQLENQIDSPCIARNLITKVNTTMINTNACLASSFVCVTITMYSLCYFFRFQLNFPSDCIRNMIIPLMDKKACLLSEACGSSPITRITHSLSDELSNKWEKYIKYWRTVIKRTINSY